MPQNSSGPAPMGAPSGAPAGAPVVLDVTHLAAAVVSEAEAVMAEAAAMAAEGAAFHTMPPAAEEPAGIAGPGTGTGAPAVVSAGATPPEGTPPVGTPPGGTPSGEGYAS